MSKIKLGKTGVEVIKEWVIKTFLKQQPKGVLTTLPKKDFVDLNTAITAERLMRNGVDPNAIKNVDQVENIINQLNKPRAVAADSPEGKGITEALFGKKGEVFNIQGEKLDPNLPISGGTQQGKKINREFFERDAEAKEVQKRIESGVASTVEKMLRMDPIDAMKEANKIIKREGPYKNLSQKDARNILDSTEDHIFERNIKPRETDMNFDEGATDEVTKAYNDAVKKGKFKGTEEDFRNKIDDMMDEDFAIGGRVGLKKGMDRRTFMKIMGGLTTIPVFGKFFKGAEVAAPVVEKAAEVASGAPPYFFNLVNRIRALGKQSPGPKERTETYKYKDYEMQIDNDTGQIEITKQKLGYDDRIGEGVVSEEYMSLKPGRADETTGGKKVADEYEENTGYTDKDGKLKDVEPGVSKETVMDGSISKEELEQEIVEQLSKEAPSIKKASGGIARMLGE
jgi:hypothetical protein